MPHVWQAVYVRTLSTLYVPKDCANVTQDTMPNKDNAVSKHGLRCLYDPHP